MPSLWPTALQRLRSPQELSQRLWTVPVQNQGRAYRTARPRQVLSFLSVFFGIYTQDYALIVI